MLAAQPIELHGTLLISDNLNDVNVNTVRSGHFIDRECLWAWFCIYGVVCFGSLFCLMKYFNPEKFRRYEYDD